MTETMNRELALLSMGYRKVKGSTMEEPAYCKPIGFMLLSFRPATNELFSVFLDVSGKPNIWDVLIVKYDETNPEDFLRELKYTESNIKTNYAGYGKSEFHFLTLQDKMGIYF